MWANTCGAAAALITWLAAGPRWGMIALGVATCSAAARIIAARWHAEDGR
jgi:hypothetical protein